MNGVRTFVSNAKNNKERVRALSFVLLFYSGKVLYLFGGFGQCRIFPAQSFFKHAVNVCIKLRLIKHKTQSLTHTEQQCYIALAGDYALLNGDFIRQNRPSPFFLCVFGIGDIFGSCRCFARLIGICLLPLAESLFNQCIKVL